MSDAILQILSAIVSAIIAGPVGYYFGRKTRREQAVVSDARAAQRHLQALRRAYLKRHRSRRRKPTDDELSLLAGELDAALNLTMDEEAVECGKVYRQVGEAIAAKDPDVNITREQEAYEELARVLRRLQRETLGG